MRSPHLVLTLALLLALPLAAALPVEDSSASLRGPATAPQQIEVATPAETFTVEGTESGTDTSDHTDAAPADVDGTVRTTDTDLTLEGPRCKLDSTKLKSHDDAARSCETGRVDTNAGLDTVQVDLDITLASASTADPDTAATTQGTVTTLDPVAARGTVFLAAAAAGASLASLYGIWRLLKWTGLAAIVPLYSHISDTEILDDPNRANIYRLIQSEPGISTKDVADRLDLAWGTVTHHLAKLEKRRFVVSKKYGKYRRYFANGTGGTEHKDELAVLRLDRTSDIATLIKTQPGLTQKQVSDHLGVSSSTILWHVKRLEAVHLVTKIRDGKQVRYYPAQNLEEATLIAPA